MYQLVKRGIGFILSLVACIVLLPIFILIAIAIKIESRGPIFFGQRRVGKDKRIFTMYKFRTMRIDAPHDMPTHLLENPEQYITKVGALLRKTSLDELPQILHIVTGRMALIGPRPALWNQEDLIELRDQFHANQVRPGLTGWAQINGRDEISLQEKARLDGEYVDKMSFAFDLKIFFATIRCVFARDGIHEGKLETKKSEN